MIREGHAGRFRVLAVVDGHGAIELGSVRTREEAEQADRQARLIEEAGPACAAVFADRWIEEFPRQHSRSNRQMAYMIRAFAREFGPRALDEITAREARAWALRNRSAARYARSLYEDAISVGLADSNPFRGIRLERRKQVRVPTEEEVRALIETLDSPYSEAAGFAAYTGLRKGELLALLGSDVEGKTLRVERQMGEDGKIAEVKNYTPRTIAVLPQARPFLPDTRAEVRLFPITSPLLGHYWRRARRRIGSDDLVFHSLRHFCATWLLNLGASPVDISLQLGHRDGGRLVQELYGHPDEAIARERLDHIAEADQHD